MQASTIACTFCLRELGDQRLQLPLAVPHDAASGQFLEDDPVDLGAPAGRQLVNDNSALFVGYAGERLGHGEARAEKRDRACGRLPRSGRQSRRAMSRSAARSLRPQRPSAL